MIITFGLVMMTVIGALRVADRRPVAVGSQAAVFDPNSLANLAIATAETRTDNVWWQAWTHEDMAVVLERAGRIDERVKRSNARSRSARRFAVTLGACLSDQASLHATRTSVPSPAW